MDLPSLNKSNRAIESNVFSVCVFSANTWMTLAAPLIIGLFASKIFAKDNFSDLETAFFSVTLMIHIVFAVIIFMAGNRKSTTLSVDETISEISKLKNEVIPKAKSIFEVCKTQQSVTYLMTLELESIIDEANSKQENYSRDERLQDWESGLDRILWHLVENRSQLFGYKSDAFYNFALYLYDKSSDELIIKWREHDDRLSVTNRKWKPGFGHVGLAFIQGEAKICQDILTSSELSDSSSGGPDKKKYRSFISVPIKDSYKVIDGKKPLGVLVFTSNHAGQFSWERDKIFTLTVAKILSIYIERQIASLTESAK